MSHPVSGGAAAAHAYHAATTHGGSHDRTDLVRFRPLDPARRPAPFTRFPGHPVRSLPRDVARAGLPAVAALSGETPARPADTDERALARLLYSGFGVTRVTHVVGGEPVYFRAAMSAGNLHPVDVYVASARGLALYDPLEHALVTVHDTDVRSGLAAAAADPDLARVPAVLVCTGWQWRTAWKYGERGYRHLYWDLGTALAQVLTAAAATGDAARVVTAFVDAEVAAVVAADRRQQFPLALVAVGDPTGAPVPPAPAPPFPEPPTPPSPHAVDFPLVRAVHEAGDLGDADAVRRWRAADRPTTPAAPARTPRPAPAAHDAPATDAERVEALVARRGSTRVFRTAPVPADVLTWAIAVAARPVPWDATPRGASHLVHLVAVHDVTAVPAGLHRFAGDRHEVVREGDVRALARRLCLDQPLGGDGAYTAFHACDLAPLLDALGARAYRVAQLEAGIASGRLALAAAALGAGATGLTFYDDLVSVAFDTDAAPMLATAVGVAAYRSTPGGPPGHPAHLRRYGTLMDRLADRLRRSAD